MMAGKDLIHELDFPPWKPRIGLVPHLTIETNMTCNFSCKSCYNINHDHVKTLEEIMDEINLGLSKRKADSITLMGGEPTLHPNIEQIIQFVKTKGVFCQILTNGYLFYQDDKYLFLKKLVDAGLDRIMLHVDSGQSKYTNPIETLHTLFKKTGKFKLLTSVSWTIYESETGKLPFLIREFMKYPHFDGMLTLIDKSVDLAIRSDYKSSSANRLFNEYYSLKNELQLVPSVYLPSSVSDDEIKWLVYLYYINSLTGESFYISPRLTRLYQKVYLFVFNREIFGNPPTRWAFGLSLIVAGLVEILIKPNRLKDFFKLIKKSKGIKKIRMHYIAIQDGPEYNPDMKEVSICYHCPDATVRNGKITPVCLADRMNPLSGSKQNTETRQALADTVFKHLHEL